MSVGKLRFPFHVQGGLSSVLGQDWNGLEEDKSVAFCRLWLHWVTGQHNILSGKEQGFQAALERLYLLCKKCKNIGCLLVLALPSCCLLCASSQRIRGLLGPQTSATVLPSLPMCDCGALNF